jgi:hypothetical protein
VDDNFLGMSFRLDRFHLYPRPMTVGTVIWTLPDGQTYVTTPGSALLFPSLCAPTDPLDMPQPSDDGRCGDRAAMMPKRRRTRAQNRAHRVAAERRQNRDARSRGRRTAALLKR